ncbi:uncharacterized protein RP689-like [Xenia sp. Carnegie-2017]|uniref:uncharacterized protein RP689-like n=1 Tax=Xenia sp. Carnegie-2017 TaxID=2897299 RepID=UPI001F037893|nr:uncharacterized protein RP689-like [Xenia sp. Carnegie-2017]
MINHLHTRVKQVGPKWLVLSGFLVLLIYFFKLNIDTHNTHELDSEQNPRFPCERTTQEMKELGELFKDVHEILNRMRIRHFLIYGSIWGAYRVQGPLPWDYDIDIGILGDEAYSKIPHNEFIKAFEAKGIKVDDHTSLSSCYYFRRGDFAQVDVDIFYRTRNYMHRSGLVTWILYYNYQMYHTFPSWMLDDPLPTVKFIDVEMPVPRGGKEILKYLYPHDWETPFVPAACRSVQNNELLASRNVTID